MFNLFKKSRKQSSSARAGTPEPLIFKNGSGSFALRALGIQPNVSIFMRM